MFLISYSFIYKEKVEHLQAERIKISYQEINFIKNISEVQALFLTFVVLAAFCFCEDEYKIRTSFKTLVLRNAATWWLHETSG